MKIVESAEVIEKLGLKDDRHAVRDSSRQVLLLEKEMLDMLELVPGQVKENITTSGISLMPLTRGTMLMVGKDVQLELTKPCAPCNRMEEIRPGLLASIAGKRGMLARVIRGGVIHRGDEITILTNI